MQRAYSETGFMIRQLIKKMKIQQNDTWCMVGYLESGHVAGEE